MCLLLKTKGQKIRNTFFKIVKSGKKNISPEDERKKKKPNTQMLELTRLPESVKEFSFHTVGNGKDKTLLTQSLSSKRLQVSSFLG